MAEYGPKKHERVNYYWINWLTYTISIRYAKIDLNITLTGSIPLKRWVIKDAPAHTAASPSSRLAAEWPEDINTNYILTTTTITTTTIISIYIC